MSTNSENKQIEIKLSDKYKSLWTSKTRYVILSGGRGSGKSFAVNLFASQSTFTNSYTTLFTRYTNTSASKSIIPEFTDKVELQNFDNYFNINKNEVTNILTGHNVIFTGLKTSSGKQTAALKSIHEVVTWILDEAEELDDEEFFDKLDLSLRHKTEQNRIILVLNPTYKNHFIYKRFFEDAGVNDDFNGIKGDVTYINTTYLDNIDNLSESYLNIINNLKDTNYSKYLSTVICQWQDIDEGVVFPNWEFGEFNNDLDRIVFAQDYGFNIDPTTLVKIGIDKKHKLIYVKEYLYKPFLTTNDIYEINKAATNNYHTIIADNAEPRLISELESLGNVIEAVKKPKILDSIGVVQGYKLIVEPNSTNTAKELRLYKWIKNKQIPIDKYNHILDAIRYGVTYLLDTNEGDYYFS
jgi:phage terminase large subunit